MRKASIHISSSVQPLCTCDPLNMVQRGQSILCVIVPPTHLLTSTGLVHPHFQFKFSHFLNKSKSDMDPRWRLRKGIAYIQGDSNGIEWKGMPCTPAEEWIVFFNLMQHGQQLIQIIHILYTYQLSVYMHWVCAHTYLLALPSHSFLPALPRSP